jgi:protein phosphatase methylesterase 1
MGGSVVVRTTHLLLEKKYKISGVAVLDVVEGSNQISEHTSQPDWFSYSTGSALDALPYMHSLLNARPDGFDSVEEAIEWQYVSSFQGL